MKLKASANRNNDDFLGMSISIAPAEVPFGAGCAVSPTLRITLANGDDIEAILDDLSREDVEEEYWFAFDYDGYAFNGELFYPDEDSNRVALNIYTTVPDGESKTGLGMGTDIGTYAECELVLD